jgi:hypothetical protein
MQIQGCVEETIVWTQVTSARFGLLEIPARVEGTPQKDALSEEKKGLKC